MTNWETIHHCPNLTLISNENIPYPVTVTQDQNRPKVTEHYKSLPDFWSSWYRAYLDDKRPRLIVRYEDLLFHPMFVLESISNCTGTPFPKRIRYIKKRAKRHGRSRNLLQVIRQYSSIEGQRARMSQKDQNFARRGFDTKLMHLLHYRHPELSSLDRKQTISPSQETK